MGADLFSHCVEGDAFSASNDFLLGIVGPRAENQKASFGYGIKESIGGFKILSKAIVGKEDDRTFLLEEHI